MSVPRSSSAINESLLTAEERKEGPGLTRVGGPGRLLPSMLEDWRLHAVAKRRLGIMCGGRLHSVQIRKRVAADFEILTIFGFSIDFITCFVPLETTLDTFHQSL